MCMSRAYYVDLYSYENFHRGYNKSSLEMFSAIFDEVVCYSCESSYKTVFPNSYEVPENITHRSIFSPSFAKGKFSAIIKQLFPLLTVLKPILQYKKGDVFFLNYNIIPLMWVLNLWSRFSGAKVIIMNHNQLEVLTNQMSIHTFLKPLLLKMKSSKVKLGDNFYFACLGDSILDNLQPVLPEVVLEHFISFNHTWNFDKPNKELSNDTGIKRIGVLGSINNQNRYLNQLLDLRNRLPKSITVEVIGKVSPNCTEILQNNQIYFYPEAVTQWISQQKLYEESVNVDLLVLLYPADRYKLCASGALFDAINSENLIYTISNDYFKYVDSLVKFGYLFESVDSMVDSILTSDHNKEICAIDFDDVKQTLSPEGEAIRFKETLINKGIL